MNPEWTGKMQVDKGREDVLIPHLEKAGMLEEIDFEMVRLEIGDVMVAETFPVEIKRIKPMDNPMSPYSDYNDLWSSLKDKRLYRQAVARAETYGNSIMVLEIHKGANPYGSGLTKDRFDKVLGRLSSHYLTTTHVTTSAQETAEYLLMLYQRSSEVHRVPPSETRPKANSLRDAQINFLVGLLDVGDKSAEDLLDYFGAPIMVIREISTRKITFTPGGNPRAIKNGIKGFGPKFYLKNQEMLFTDTREATKEDGKDDGG